MILDIEPYATIGEANSYFSTRLNSENWDESDDVSQLKALKTATRFLNRLRYKGNKTLPLQYNQFPRNNSTIIPDSIKIATCEIAYELLGGIDMELETQNLAFLRNEYASVKTEADSKIVLEHMRAGIPSAIAWNYLKPYLIDPFSVELNRPYRHCDSL